MITHAVCWHIFCDLFFIFDSKKCIASKPKVFWCCKQYHEWLRWLWFIFSLKLTICVGLFRFAISCDCDLVSSSRSLCYLHLSCSIRRTVYRVRVCQHRISELAGYYDAVQCLRTSTFLFVNLILHLVYNFSCRKEFEFFFLYSQNKYSLPVVFYLSCVILFRVHSLSYS